MPMIEGTPVAVAALDAHDGEPLWHVPINQEWSASPITYIGRGTSRCQDGGPWTTGTRTQRTKRPRRKTPPANGGWPTEIEDYLVGGRGRLAQLPHLLLGGPFSGDRFPQSFQQSFELGHSLA